ncbi:hypothetical protein EV143_10744 [Flavobacterium chryseum]|uniref:hypothetical protein n=1 Tax=Flavobacterium sp. P3160 TaxID=2512113 RepID=UPI0010619694|nr:hypothetical protein [Flavobacterium sp. P3160]TDO72739.1 hypothetical protein EV143_10744 [Flavobacterium sp. P3160]
MKTSKYTKVAVIIMVILFVVVSAISCSTHVHSSGGSGKVPPGQAKKMSGSKSAKAYAPGQQKKH